MPDDMDTAKSWANRCFDSLPNAQSKPLVRAEVRQFGLVASCIIDVESGIRS